MSKSLLLLFRIVFDLLENISQSALCTSKLLFQLAFIIRALALRIRKNLIKFLTVEVMPGKQCTRIIPTYAHRSHPLLETELVFIHASWATEYYIRLGIRTYYFDIIVSRRGRRFFRIGLRRLSESDIL